MRALCPRGGAKITHLGEAAAHHTRYRTNNCKCVVRAIGLCYACLEGKRVKSVGLNHLGGTLLAVAAAGLLAAVGLFMVVLYAQPAEANFPSKPGKIVFSQDDGNDFEIYTINPNGGGKKQLTDNSSDDRSPSYSPSGKKIAFQGYDGNDNEIYTINPGGGGRQQVTDNGTRDFEPYWGSQ
jgi:hypothetical protein